MPCRSDGYESESTKQIVDFYLKPELDNVTNLLCTLTHVIKLQLPTVLYESVVDSSMGLREWINEHQKVDEDRWYNHYRQQYSNFSKVEIVKMINEGILAKP